MYIPLSHGPFPQDLTGREEGGRRLKVVRFSAKQVLIFGDVDMSGNMLPFNSMSPIDLQYAYSLPSLRHLIVPALMVERYRELDKLVVMGEGWVPITYHGAENVKDALSIAFPEAKRHMSRAGPIDSQLGQSEAQAWEGNKGQRKAEHGEAKGETLENNAPQDGEP